MFAAAALAADPALTVYNQSFAIIREIVPLDLKPGINSIEFSGVTSQLEPASVLLRDPASRQNIVVLEQGYRADPVSIDILLAKYEGQFVDFQVRNGDRTEIVRGKIVRAGSILKTLPAPLFTPVIEVDGKLRFELPGTPLFPSLGEGTKLKPTLTWVLETDRAGRVDAELSYSSRGFNWEADYNIVQTGSSVDIAGWVTLENHSGTTFENARVKLMAGDVRKLQDGRMRGGVIGGIVGGVPGGVPSVSPVAEKSFDEYHLYTLARPITLHGRESKQVEFVRAANIKSILLYVYDGAKYDWNRIRMSHPDMLRQDSSIGSESHSKVWVMREFVNTQANRLGMPLPKGQVRFYRRDTDGRLEFTGEDTIDHTPKDETIRVFTGAAFDIVGERKRTRFQMDHARSSADESFEITVRNRKQEPVQVRVVEHLYRWSGWDIPASSLPFSKRDAHTVEFIVPLAAGESKTLTYSVQYRW